MKPIQGMIALKHHHYDLNGLHALPKTTTKHDQTRLGLSSLALNHFARNARFYHDVFRCHSRFRIGRNCEPHQLIFDRLLRKIFKIGCLLLNLIKKPINLQGLTLVLVTARRV